MRPKRQNGSKGRIFFFSGSSTDNTSLSHQPVCVQRDEAPICGTTTY
ncbi:MAG: hypothetical protein IJ764_02855 [Bacteroidales bacterium]|nr:hypothetical protein [Bacteroidales bacterium]